MRIDCGCARIAVAKSETSSEEATMSAPGRPKRESLPLGGMARSAKGVPL
jgi:hypothetical protein